MCDMSFSKILGQGNEDTAINKTSEEGDGDNSQYNANNQSSGQGLSFSKLFINLLIN